MLALSDDEILDFVAAGSLRAFTVLCVRKLPWLALCALNAHGDRARALDGAARVMLRAWENAPLWPPRSGRLDSRLLDLLEAGPGTGVAGPGDIDDEDIAVLIRRVVGECANRPQKRAGWLDRLFGG
ncbi:MAG: hypothetical protein AB7G62_21045 [Magnetospirillum sp.]